jgi:hypothetical protein
VPSGGVHHDKPPTKGSGLSATYTWDVFSTLGGYGSCGPDGDANPDEASVPYWGGYWNNRGQKLLERRAALFARPQRMVFGATTFRENAEVMSAGIDANTLGE